MESDDNSQDTNLDVKQKDEQSKEEMKENADRKTQAQASYLKIGETVLLSQRKINKFSITFPSNKD